MKFLKINYSNNIQFFDNDNDFFYDYIKLHSKNRKIYPKIKKGLNLKIKKTSINRDKNNLLSQQFINIFIKKGKKIKITHNFNIFLENFFFILINEMNVLKKYKDYEFFYYLNNINMNFSNIDYILNFYIKKLESIFDIKSKKNDKKSKSKSKYSYEMKYIPKEKRLKNSLKVFKLYSENFKYYKIWERIFWMLSTTFFDYENSFIFKRRLFIYNKSIKFFKNNKK